MNLNISTHKGESGKPVAIFIHGLGMDRNFWIDPLNTKVFAKNIPMKVFAAKKPHPLSNPARIQKPTVGIIPDKINHLWAATIEREYNAICWSQSRPVGPIHVAIDELGYIIKETKKLFPGSPIALIGHSRGGLVARKIMEKKDPAIKALITISSPHKGSSLPGLARFLSPLQPAMKKLLPDNIHGTAADVLKRFSEFIEGSALRELLPGSDFFVNLKDSPHKDIAYVSFGGTTTKLITVYGWKKEGVKTYPTPLLIIPDSVIKIIPAAMLPEEVIPGKGDFLVTAGSSRLPWAEQHYDLEANHISIIWHKKTIKHTIEVLEEL